MSVNLSDIQTNGIRLLNEKIKYLQEEISNTQADKDFVWSLWRQLQSTKPDLTNAISIALNREKEKVELKDQKVLKILDYKDNKIEELLDAVSTKNMEISQLKDKIAKLDGGLNEKNENINFLKLNIKTFEDKIIVFEQMIRNQDVKHAQKLSENEVERQKLISKIDSLTNQLAIRQQKESNMEKVIKNMDKNINELEDDTTRSKRTSDIALKELNENKAKVAKLNLEVERLLNEIKNKNEHIESLQLKMSDLLKQNTLHIEYTNQQEQIIHQLKIFQSELQRSFKTQEETSTSEINLLQQMYNETCKKFEENLSIQSRLRLELEEKSMIIRNSKKLNNENKNQFNQSPFLHQIIMNTDDMSADEVKRLKAENENLKQEVFDKNTIINELNMCRGQTDASHRLTSMFLDSPGLVQKLKFLVISVEISMST
jgi:centlein